MTHRMPGGMIARAVTRLLGLRRLLIAIALTSGFPLACATMGVAGDTVSFVVETNVPDAMVWVDDRLVGSVATVRASGTRLRVGFHRVEIRHPEHYSFFKEIDPKRGEPVVVRAELHALVQ